MQFHLRVELWTQHRNLPDNWCEIAAAFHREGVETVTLPRAGESLYRTIDSMYWTVGRVDVHHVEHWPSPGWPFRVREEPDSGPEVHAVARAHLPQELTYEVAKDMFVAQGFLSSGPFKLKGCEHSDKKEMDYPNWVIDH